jgi:hypothetical protein
VHRCRMTATVCILGLLALSGAACSSSPASSGTTTTSSHGAAASSTPVSTSPPHWLMTSAMVPGLLASYAAKNNAANLHLSTSMQDANEEGSAAAIDDETIREDKQAGYATLDGAHYYPFSYQAVSSDVFEQTTYPADFVVVARTVYAAGTPSADRSSCPGLGTLFVFAKDSASSPWRVALEPTVTLAAIPAFFQGSVPPWGMFGNYEASNASLKIPLASIGATYAQALQSYASHGTLSEGLTASMFSGSCAIFPNLHQTVLSVEQKGLSMAVDFTFGPTSVIGGQQAWGVHGGALVVLEFTGTETASAPSGNTISVTHIAGDPGSYEMSPGRYLSITYPIDGELVVFDPKSSSAGGAVPVGSYIGVLAGTGTLAG